MKIQDSINRVRVDRNLFSINRFIISAIAFAVALSITIVVTQYVPSSTVESFWLITIWFLGYLLMWLLAISNTSKITNESTEHS